MTGLYRKSRRSFNEPGHAHFLTYSCHERLPLLAKDRVRRWVIDAMDVARRRHEFALLGYVIMPEHVHQLIWEWSSARFWAGLEPVHLEMDQLPT